MLKTRTFLILFLVFIFSVSNAKAEKYTGTCIHLFSNLENCTPYKCTHPHPDKNKSVYLDIKGKTKEGYCHVIQTTSSGDYFECKYKKESVALWSKTLKYFFKYGMFAITEDEERASNKTFDEECSTEPMEGTKTTKNTFEDSSIESNDE